MMKVLTWLMFISCLIVGISEFIEYRLGMPIDTNWFQIIVKNSSLILMSLELLITEYKKEKK